MNVFRVPVTGEYIQYENNIYIVTSVAHCAVSLHEESMPLPLAVPNVICKFLRAASEEFDLGELLQD